MINASNGGPPHLVGFLATYAHHDESQLVAALIDKYPQDDLLPMLRDTEPEIQKAAAFALSLIGDITTGAHMAEVLHTDDATVHLTVEQSLWRLWFRSGRDDVDALLSQGVRLMEAQQLDEAQAIFDRVIAMASTFAEGYNQRAIVFYLTGEWERSIADCEQAIALNPVHFGALAGMGHCYLKRHEIMAALAAYERALAINPRMTGIRRTVEQLRSILDDDERLA